MSASTSPNLRGPQASSPARWCALVVIAVSQLMISVDSTIVNIALPAAQHQLGFTGAIRQWVITAYLLAFGGLLLLGGRVGDLRGHKKAFLAGVTGFAIASMIGGLAANTWMLITARAVQGGFAALMGPAALSLLTATFPDPEERGKALGVFGAIAGSGAAVGLIAGGALTEFLDWRWALLVNAPLGALVAIGAAVVVTENRAASPRKSMDLAGAAVISAALVLLILGFGHAETSGWTAVSTWLLLAAGAALTAMCAGVERRRAEPLLPLPILTDSTRAGVYLSQGLSVMTMFGLLLFLTYDYQVVHGYTAFRTGIAFLPLVAGMLLGASVIAGQLPHVSPRLLAGAGCLIAAAGMALLIVLTPGSSYWLILLPAELIFGTGLGISFTPAMNLATHNINPADVGVASGLINASQQIGGAIGAAFLNTIAALATATWLNSHVHAANASLAATVHGYAIGARWAVGILLLAAFTGLAMIRSDAHKTTATTAATEPV